jgi:hypothetical protein
MLSLKGKIFVPEVWKQNSTQRMIFMGQAKNYGNWL